MIESEEELCRNQISILRHAMNEEPLTMLEASYKTGILRANICRYVSYLRERNQLFLVGYRFCSISKRKVGEYSTDEKAKLESRGVIQNSLFDEL